MVRIYNTTSFLIKLDALGEVIYAQNLNTTTEANNMILTAIALPNNKFAIVGNTGGFPQYAIPSISSGNIVLYLCTLNGDGTYSNGIIYKYLSSVTNSQLLNSTSLKSRMDGNYNLGFTNFIGSGPSEFTIMQLDKNFRTSCDGYDVSNDFYLTEENVLSLINKSYFPISNGETYNHTFDITDYQADTIITLCENIAKADFTLENPCPNKPVYFTDQSSGNIISRIWSFDNGTFISEEENPVVEFSGTGIFPVQLVVSDGCVTDTLFRDIEILPTSFEEFDTTVCSERPIYFHNNVFTETVDEAQTFTYIDTLTNYLGCDSIVTLSVLVEPCGCELIFPNVFTPDNDGINDIFYPIIECDFMIKNYRLLIFNRWGQLVFESQHPTEQWDGTYQGKTLPMDVLMYKVQYDVNDEDGIDNRQVNQVGDVTLIR